MQGRDLLCGVIFTHGVCENHTTIMSPPFPGRGDHRGDGSNQVGLHTMIKSGMSHVLVKSTNVLSDEKNSPVENYNNL